MTHKCFALLGLGVLASFTQTVDAALVAGDIAVIGYNSDGPSTGGGDDFSFVALKTLAAGETIHFTDNGVTGSAFRSGEGFVTFTAGPLGVTQGAVVLIDNPTDGTGPTSNFGTVTRSSGAASAGDISKGVYDFSGSGDQILSFQGTLASPTFIDAINSDGTSFAAGATTTNNTGVPTGLSAGSTARALFATISGTNTGDQDNADYVGIRTGTLAEIRAAIADRSNYSYTDGTGDQSIALNTTAFVVVPEPAGFALLALGGLLALRRRRY